METVQLQATLRERLGSRPAKRLRADGFVPGVVYAKQHEPIDIAVEARELRRALHTKAGENVIVKLLIAKPETGASGQPRQASPEGRGKPKETTTIVKEVQHDPVRGGITHIDFHQISLTETITVGVAVVAQGEAVGVKQDGGVLEYLLRELTIECLPTQIPERFAIDVAAMKIGDTKHAKDFAMPSGVKLVTDPEAAIISILTAKVEKVLDEAAAAAATEGAAEPEVLKQKKPEEIEAEAAAKASEKEAKEGKKKEEKAA
ncbi:MAG: 50S ribosomal protein L25 [Candidatus Omnitrophica bacterium]|nr:50S ribosomal protein L25 [Candidatus Omnitrophota bacterium]